MGDIERHRKTCVCFCVEGEMGVCTGVEMAVMSDSVI